jgi:hypothetical protein
MILALALLAPTGQARALGRIPADAQAASEQTEAPKPQPRVDRTRIPAAQADAVLGAGWQKSTDRAWTLVGSKDGLHVLAAKKSEAFAWQTIATLSEPGFETDAWVGNGCVTASGTRLVVVYAPRAFTNDEVARDRAAFTAVVDLRSGVVRKFAVTSTLAYFNPGCGTGEAAVLAQYNHQGSASTRLVRIDATKGTTSKATVSAGELTSAVPLKDKVVAAAGRRLVEVGAEGQLTHKLDFAGAVSRLRVASGRLVLSETTDEQTTVRRLAANLLGSEVIGSGHRSVVTTFQAPAGRVWVAGARHRSKSLPGIGFVAQGKRQVSDGGGLTVKEASIGAGGQAVIETVTQAGKAATFEVPTPTGSTDQTSPALAVGQPRTAAGEADNPIDAGATCAVPRNDIQTQVYQPNPRQIEWAVDQAVNDNLKTARPADWKRSGLPSYTPQLMTKFQLPALRGGGIIPPQILLGILAQESNLWQASGHAIETWTGNPLIGNYYGRIGNGWSIDFSKADCGYGLGQITDGMRKGNTVWGGLTEQRAIALDYTVNIAAAAKLLADKWNQLYDAGLLVNGASSSRIESWFGAVWAYNSGFHPKTATPGQPWGLGWTNNPLSGLWDPARTPFGEHPSDAAHPQDWPYPEKILGWAAYPIDNPRLGAGYRAAWWTDTSGGQTGATKRHAVKPPLPTFCSLTVNACDPNAAPGAHCTRADSQCWWYKPVQWKDCKDATMDPCGRGLVRFDTTYSEPQPDRAHTPPDPEQNPPVCDKAGLPVVRIVDDVPTGTRSRRPQCTSASASEGTFKLQFGATEVNGTPVQYTSKIDFHQVGLGYQGHAWFTHTTWSQTSDQSRTVTGTWRLNAPMPGWTRVLVHLPGVATNTRQARYLIDRGDGTAPVSRYVNTSVGTNKWVSLGIVRLGSGVPSVSLSNRTMDAKYFDSTINPYARERQENIAWDAVAFQALPAKPFLAAAVGDSYGSGEGANDYLPETNHSGADVLARSACHRSANAWPRRVHPPATAGAELGAVSDAFSPKAELSFVSCSGAIADNVDLAVDRDKNLPSYLGGGQYNEVAQLEAGYIDKNTDLVFVSLGGNDAHFSDVLKFCAKSAPRCQDATMPGDTQKLDLVERDMITNTVQTKVTGAIERIHREAPNATIIYAGYPRLFDGTGVLCVDGLGLEEMMWMNEMSDLLAEKTMATLDAVRLRIGASITYVDTRPGFVGRGVCTADEAINHLVVTKTAGDKPGDLVSAESFHPKPAGTALYATAIQGKMGW